MTTLDTLLRARKIAWILAIVSFLGWLFTTFVLQQYTIMQELFPLFLGIAFTLHGFLGVKQREMELALRWISGTLAVVGGSALMFIGLILTVTYLIEIVKKIG